MPRLISLSLLGGSLFPPNTKHSPDMEVRFRDCFKKIAFLNVITESFIKNDDQGGKCSIARISGNHSSRGAALSVI